MIDFCFLTIVKFVSMQGKGAPHPSAAVPPPVASHDRGWIGILLGILAVLVLIILVIVLLFYLRYAPIDHAIFNDNARSRYTILSRHAMNHSVASHNIAISLDTSTSHNFVPGKMISS